MRERDSTLQTTLFGLCKIPSRVLKDTQEIYLATGQSLLSAPGRVPFSEENVPGWLECPPLDIFLRFRLPGPWAPHCEDSLPCPGDLRPRSLALLLLLLLHAYCLPNLLRHRRQRLGGKNSLEFLFCILFLIPKINASGTPHEVRTRIADATATRFNHYTMASHKVEVISMW